MAVEKMTTSDEGLKNRTRTLTNYVCFKDAREMFSRRCILIENYLLFPRLRIKTDDENWTAILHMTPNMKCSLLFNEETLHIVPITDPF